MAVKEEWKDIPGHEGLYQASSLGRIRSLTRVVYSRNWYARQPFPRTITGRILKPGRYCKTGHLSVVLGRRTAGRPVHQLVMEAFVGPAPDGMEVCHINGDPADNRLINLRYDTRRNNILDVYRQGKRWRKLNLNDVSRIRFALFCGWRGSDLAREYYVSQSCISAIKTGRSYSWTK